MLLYCDHCNSSRERDFMFSPLLFLLQPFLFHADNIISEERRLPREVWKRDKRKDMVIWNQAIYPV